MKYAIVYNTLTGNAKILADAIKENIAQKDLIYFGKPSEKANEADLIYVGFWTNMGKVDPETIKYVQSLENKKIFLFGTAGFINKEYEEKIINDSIKDFPKSIDVVSYYVCQGKMGQKVKDRYLKLKQDGQKNIDFMLANWEKGQSHPDQDDIKNLLAKIK